MTDEDEDPTAAAATDPVAAHWDAVIEDVEATAVDLEDAGWKTLALRPGDVTPLAGEDVDRPRFDVLLPDDEFEELLAVVEDRSFEASDVYANVAEGTAFLLVVMRDEAAEAAILFPVYYGLGEEAVETLEERAAETGTVRTRLRRLQRDRAVTFAHDDPDLFFPGSE